MTPRVGLAPPEPQSQTLTQHGPTPVDTLPPAAIHPFGPTLDEGAISALRSRHARHGHGVPRSRGRGGAPRRQQQLAARCSSAALLEVTRRSRRSERRCNARDCTPATPATPVRQPREQYYPLLTAASCGSALEAMRRVLLRIFAFPPSPRAGGVVRSLAGLEGCRAAGRAALCCHPGRSQSYPKSTFSLRISVNILTFTTF